MREHLTTRKPGLGRSTVRPGESRIEFQAVPAGAAYLVEATGRRWRIYDCVLRRGRFERVYIESNAATCRIFVAPDGRQMGYPRPRHAPFQLSPAECERQLAAAHELGPAQRLDLR